MPFAWATGPGDESAQGYAPCASLEPLDIPRATLRAASLATAESLFGVRWKPYGRDRADGLDQLGFLGEVYYGATGRIRDFGKGYPAPANRALAAHAKAIAEALATWRGLSRVSAAAVQSGDMLLIASPTLSPAFSIGVVVSPAANGPGALLTIAPGPGVHKAAYGGALRAGFRDTEIVAALTWRGTP